MRSPLLIGVGAAVLISLGATATWFWLAVTPEGASQTATSTPLSALPRDSGAMLLFTTHSGEVVSVPDFTYGHPSLEVEETGETYVYVTQDDGGNEMDPMYGIVYESKGTLFIGLFATPLGEARQKAEGKLKEIMTGVPLDILCQLPITVGVPDTIQPMYAGKDLRLSFCPGAVALP